MTGVQIAKQKQNKNRFNRCILADRLERSYRRLSRSFPARVLTGTLFSLTQQVNGCISRRAEKRQIEALSRSNREFHVCYQAIDVELLLLREIPQRLRSYTMTLVLLDSWGCRRMLLRQSRYFAIACLCLALAENSPQSLFGQDRESSASNDAHLPSRLRTLEDHVSFEAPDPADWPLRRTQLKDQLTVALGLEPSPQANALQSQVFGSIEKDGYRISKVIVETLPNFFLTGSLYEPLNLADQKLLPAILCPHGHWEDGRMHRASDAEVANLLASGAERFEAAARNHIQARCVQMARMGCIVFAYDMLGYADSQQISIERAHRWGVNQINPETRSDANDAPRMENLLFSTRAELYQQSVMSLQILQNLQAVNFVKTLPHVDSKQIAITGASGGGTQSFVTAAISDDIAGAFPAVMVSTGMQGGCTCENSSLLRVHTNNVEIAALIAPRPLMMTSADDWTVNMKQDGFPALRKIYEDAGVSENVKLFAATHFPHNFNHVSRVALYGFINRLFGLGLQEPILERDFDWSDREELSVWDAEHQRPEADLAFENSLLTNWQTLIDTHYDLKQFKHREEFLESIAGQQLARGWNVITSMGLPWSKNLAIKAAWDIDKPVPEFALYNQLGNRVALGTITPSDAIKAKADRRIVIDWTSIKRVRLHIGETHNPTFTASSDRDSTLDIHWQIADPLANDMVEPTQQQLVGNPRPAAAFTYGYNAAALVRRAGALMAIVDDLDIRSKQLVEVEMYAGGEDSFLALATVLQRPGKVSKLVLDESNEFRFANLESIRDKNFVPASLRYQDMPGLIMAVAFQRPETVITSIKSETRIPR